ncbi:putative ribonuclease H-like domain-containing protein [Tanacetum coccineum]
MFLIIRRAQEGNSSIKRSKVDRSYARGASEVQVTTDVDYRVALRRYKEQQVQHVDDRVLLEGRWLKLFKVSSGYLKKIILTTVGEEYNINEKMQSWLLYATGYSFTRFEDPDFPDRVYKVEKALYGLHQAPRAWYETLSTYLLDNGFQRGNIDKTLFIRRDKGDFLLVQVYVDDIIFGSTKKSLCTDFEKMMHKKFQMSSMGVHTLTLEDGTEIHMLAERKYPLTKETLKSVNQKSTININ